MQQRISFKKSRNLNLANSVLKDKQQHFSSATIRFRQLSRKGYAVFAGLKRVISIGQIAAVLTAYADAKVSGVIATNKSVNRLVGLFDENDPSAEEWATLIVINENRYLFANISLLAEEQRYGAIFPFFGEKKSGLSVCV